jgi:hypothetical protein
MSSSEVMDYSRTLTGLAKALVAGDILEDAALQDLMGVAVRLYAERVEAAGEMAAVKPSTINATDAMVTTTALLRAVNVQLFELGLWQSWAR